MKLIDFTYKEIDGSHKDKVIQVYEMDDRVLWPKDLPEHIYTEPKKKIYEAIKVSDGLGEQIYYINYDDVKLAFPVIEGALQIKTESLRTKLNLKQIRIEGLEDTIHKYHNDNLSFWKRLKNVFLPEIYKK